METQHWLIIITCISLGSFGFSYLFGYFTLQWYQALGIFGAVFAGFYFSHRKVVKIRGWREVIEQNKEDLKALGVMTETGHKTVRVSRVDEHLDVSDKGRYWYMIFGDNPNFHPLLFSVKSGRLIHVDMRGNIDESPLKTAREKPVPPKMDLGIHEVKYEEKTRPQKQAPSPQ